MATRKYLSDGTYPVGSATTLSGWESSSGVVTRALSRTKSGTSTVRAQAETVSINPYRQMLGQWVDDEPFTRDGVLGGDVDMVVTVAESATAADMFIRFRVLVTSAAGGVNRAVFDGGGASNAGVEFPTVETGRLLSFTLPDTPVAAGERIKLEVGYRATNSTATSYTGSLRYGGTGTPDLAAGDTSTAAQRPPWIEFADARVDELWTPSPVRLFLGGV